MSWMRRTFGFLILATLGASAGVAAQEGDRPWSFTPVLGFHAPTVSGLSEGEFRSPLIATAQIVDVEGFNVETPIRLENPLPTLRFGPQIGLEFQWDVSAKHAFFIGMSAFEQTSISRVPGQFSLEGDLAQAINERKGTFSYTQYQLGWKYILRNKSKKYRIASRLAINEVFDIDYQEDVVFDFVSGPAAGFKRIIIYQTQTTGMLTLQAGLDAQYFLADWLSIDISGGYTLGLREADLVSFSRRSDFRATDNIGLTEVMIQPRGGDVAYLTADGETYRDLKLDFDGWFAGVGVRIYY